MKRIISTVFGLALWGTGMAQADHRDLALFASPDLMVAGLIKFLLPRFSLKTGVKVHVEPMDGAAPVGVSLGNNLVGRLALRGAGQTYSVVQADPGDKAASRFIDWLLSDIGQRTIEQFAPESGQSFVGAANSGPAESSVVLSGSAERGEGLAYDNCGRCHVIGERNRMKGIGSTPSFAVLRSIDNWLERFNTFFVRNPHPSFSQIKGVTAPFDPARPPPISPLRLTPEELDDIIAFTETVEPADLGAPLVHQ